MRSWKVMALVLSGVFMGLWALAYVLPAQVASVLSGVFVIGAGLWVNRLATYRRRRSGADNPDSIEHECATAAASTTLPVALMALAAVAAWAAITAATGVALAALAAMAVVLVTYWASYASARGRC